MQTDCLFSYSITLVTRRFLFFAFAASLFLVPPSRGQEILFSDVTEASGLAKKHRNSSGWARMGIGTGAAWIDFDQDGYLDLFLPHGLGKNDLYRNNGDGTFEEVAEAMGVSDWDHKGSAIAIADYNNDGWPDIYLANADEDVLLKNVEGLSFVDVTAETGLDVLPEARGMSAAWGDYNNDGFLDLYVTQHSNFRRPEGERYDRLLLNEGGASFADVSHLIDPEARNGYGFIGAWTDFDNDGDLDIFLVNDCGFLLAGTTHTRLFRNDGGSDPYTWNFTDVAAEVGADHCHSGMGIAIGDYNRDGWTDYYYTNIGEETLLLENQQGQFVDKAEVAGVQAVDPEGVELWSWGTNFLDANLDGWLDLYVTAGTLYIFTNSALDPQENLFFLSNKDGTFTDMSASSGLNTPKRSRTSVFGDYDNDGDPDLFLVNSNEEVSLYRNEHSDGNNWLILSLEGTRSNRSGIGARIVLTDTAGDRQYWEIRSGSSLGGGDDLAAYFGLGEASVASVEITWPSGETQTLENVTANQRMHVVEPVTNVSNEPETSVTSDLALSSYPNPFDATVTLSYETAHTLPTKSTLIIYDLLGRAVHQASLPPGQKGMITWHGTDAQNNPLPAGVYLARWTHSDQSTMSHLLIKR